MAPQPQDTQQMGGMPQPGQEQQGQTMQVNGSGAALPGTPWQRGESGRSDNPQVSRPQSVEALAQQLALASRPQR